LAPVKVPAVKICAESSKEVHQSLGHTDGELRVSDMTTKYKLTAQMLPMTRIQSAANKAIVLDEQSKDLGGTA